MGRHYIEAPRRTGCNRWLGRGDGDHERPDVRVSRRYDGRVTGWSGGGLPARLCARALVF